MKAAYSESNRQLLAKGEGAGTNDYLTNMASSYSFLRFATCKLTNPIVYFLTQLITFGP